MSYFPTDIPFMSDEELRENGIRIPGNVPDTNVGNIEYIRKEDAKDALQEKVFHNLTDEFYGAMQAIDELEPADVVPYSIDPDGTLTITVPKGTKVGRVLVEEEGTKFGGLYYAD